MLAAKNNGILDHGSGVLRHRFLAAKNHRILAHESDAFRRTSCQALTLCSSPKFFHIEADKPVE